MQLNQDTEGTSSGLRANLNAEIYSTFLQMGFLFPSYVCQCTFVYSDFEMLLWQNVGSIAAASSCRKYPFMYGNGD